MNPASLGDATVWPSRHPGQDALGAYFAILRAGHFYETTSVAELLGRPPRSYGDWLRDHLPQISR
jgi:hypothetical protein